MMYCAARKKCRFSLFVNESAFLFSCPARAGLFHSTLIFLHADFDHSSIPFRSMV
ncbi:hypothetical protein [Rubritalea tangerina]|uniref:hypothetical protein n=1 Tax=Rubritalea tangerina TaxID=430798 RepID=UPI003609258B